MLVIVSVAVPEKLARRLEDARGTIPRSRFVREILEERLGDAESIEPQIGKNSDGARRHRELKAAPGE